MCPGWIATPPVQSWMDHDVTVAAKIVAQEPIGRLGKPEEVAERSGLALLKSSDIHGWRNVGHRWRLSRVISGAKSNAAWILRPTTGCSGRVASAAQLNGSVGRHMHKLSRKSDDAWVSHSYPPVFAVETTAGTERLGGWCTWWRSHSIWYLCGFSRAAIFHSLPPTYASR